MDEHGLSNLRSSLLLLRYHQQLEFLSIYDNKKIYIKFTFETVFISAMALFYFFTTLTITGIYNTNDTIVFVLGALFCGYFESRKKMES